MKASRAFGVTSLHEGNPLKYDEEQFARYMKPYPLVTLENAALRVAVASELSGRMIRMIDKASGLDVTYQPDPGRSSQNPAVSGLSVVVQRSGASRARSPSWGLVGAARRDRNVGTPWGRGSCLFARRLVTQCWYSFLRL